MDRTPACGAGDPGSNPGESTTLRSEIQHVNLLRYGIDLIYKSINLVLTGITTSRVFHLYLQYRFKI